MLHRDTPQNPPRHRPARRNKKAHAKVQRARVLQLERFESRLLFASDWQNPFVPRDSSGDGVVVPQDALVIINELNQRTLIAANGALPSRAAHPDAPFLSTDGDDFVAPIDVLVVINALNGDTQPPTITAQLAQDTAPRGQINNDRITRNARIQGQALDNLTGVTALRAQIDNGTTIPITLSPDGSYSFDPGALADGPHTVKVTVLDGRQQVGTTESSFTLDTTPPGDFTLNLVAESDTLPVGDGKTTIRLVSLAGQTETSAEVEMSSVGLVSADSAGRFGIQGVPLQLGSNNLAAQVHDAAGNTASFDTEISRDPVPGALLLAEGNSFVDEELVPVALGQSTGSRTIRFRLDSRFDQDAPSSTAMDTLLVSLVDANDAGQTLIDRGQPGTTIFAWSGGEADHVPGLVQFDGELVEIDVTSLSQLTSGRLKFQLVSTDDRPGSLIAISNVESVTDLTGAERPVLRGNTSVASTAGPLDTVGLTRANDAEVKLENIRFNSATGRYTAELSLVNRGVPMGRNSIVRFPGLPSGVTILNPSGADLNGNPYLNLASAIAPGGLGTSESSQSVLLEFSNANLFRFPFTAEVFTGAPNRAPVMDPIGPLSVMPGDFIDIAIPVVDADGDPITFSIQSENSLPNVTLTSDGRLKITPAPEQIGSYDFTLIARDGAIETIQPVHLDVVSDPITTTRISGKVLRINGEPLANMQVEVGAVQVLTAADGTFTLDLGSGPPVGDALKIRGDLFAGPQSYPFIAEKLAFLLEHSVYSGLKNVIARPIFLPALDVANGEEINPVQDETVTTPAIPGISVFVAAGTLMDQQGTAFDGVLHITEVPKELTPAALPRNLSPDLVVTIQPGDMVFATPAPMTFPNSAGWLPGTLMNLWSISPVTGEFEDVGDMRVSDDGATVETITGGVRNSSWHFVAPPAPEIITRPDRDSRNQKTNGEEKFRCAGATSTCELHSGAILEMHELASYQSLGVDHSLRLVYDSLRADPRPIVHFSVNNTQPDPALRLIADLTIARGSLSFQVPGHSGGELGLSPGEHIWALPNAPGEFGAALQADMRDQPSGQYQYTMNLGKRRFTGTQFTGSSQVEAGTFIHVNTVDSPFGSGWGLAGLHQLVENPDGSVLWIDGDGSELLFDPPLAAGQPFESPAGDFSRFERLANGTYRRTATDQTVYTFDSGNRLSMIRDRNGNTTRFDYDAAGRLTKITDPVGMETKLAIGSNGRISSFTDPVGRTTRLEYDAGGNLVRIIDPDNSQRTFEYDIGHHLIAEVDKRGNREELSYDFAGRASQARRKDGSVLNYQPAQVQGLRRPHETFHPIAPLLAQLLKPAESLTSHANGNVARSVLDQAGQVVSTVDSVGQMPAHIRDTRNLVVTEIDARGNTTAFRYDERGNRLSIRDRLTGPSVYVMTSGDAENDEKGLEALVEAGFRPTLGASTFDFDGTQADLSLFDAVLILVPGFGTDMNDAGEAALVAYVNAGGALVTGEPLINSLDDNDATLEAIIPATFSGGGFGFFFGQTTYTQATYDPILVAGLPESFTFMARDDRLVAKQGTTTFFNTSLASGAGVVGWDVGAGRVLSLSSGIVTRDFIVIEPEVSHPIYRQLLGNAIEWAIKDTETMPAYASYTYDPVFSQLTSQTDGEGRRIVIDVDPANGNARSLSQIVDAPGGSDDVVTTFTYTSQGLLDTQTDPLGRITKYEYDTRGRLIKKTIAQGTADEGVTQYEYDLAGNISAIIDELGNRTEHTYDVLNRLSQITEADPDGNGPQSSPVSKLSYDAAGNVTSVEDARGNVTRYEYDSMNRRTRIVDALNGVQTFRYDSQGNLVASIDALGQITQYRYDARNRRVEKIDPDQSSTHFEYDVDDNVVGLIDPLGNETEFAFDSRKRLTQETDPHGKSRTYEYNSADDLTQKTDRIGRRVVRLYDDLGRMTNENWISTFNSTSNPIIYTYDKASNLLSVDDFFSTVTYTYDDRNRVASVDNLGTQHSPQVVLNYEYDATGNVLSVSETIAGAAGAVTTYDYDAMNRVVGMSQAGGGATAKRVELSYNEVGQNTGIQRFDDLLGTQSIVSTSHIYDALNRVTSISHQSVGTTLAFEQVAYDAVSRVTNLTDGDGSSSFVYDHRNQLRSADHSRASLEDENFTYDANGNRVSSSEHGSGYETGTGNRLLSDGTYNYQYDAEGNLLRRTEIATGNFRTFLYDHRNRLMLVRDRNAADTESLRVTSFRYDVFDRRIFRSEDTAPATAGETLVEYFVYDRDNVLLEFSDPDGTAPSLPLPPAFSRRYLHGPATDQVFAEEGDNGTLWHLADHLGSTRDLVDNDAEVKNHIVYDSFGNVTSQTDLDFTSRYLFTGREFESLTGMYYYRNRFYDPAIGRFLSEDPIRFDSRDTNYYRYVGNDPLGMVDPNGLRARILRAEGALHHFLEVDTSQGKQYVDFSTSDQLHLAQAAVIWLFPAKGKIHINSIPYKEQSVEQENYNLSIAEGDELLRRVREYRDNGDFQYQYLGTGGLGFGGDNCRTFLFNLVEDFKPKAPGTGGGSIELNTWPKTGVPEPGTTHKRTGFKY